MSENRIPRVETGGFSNKQYFPKWWFNGSLMVIFLLRTVDFPVCHSLVCLNHEGSLRSAFFVGSYEVEFYMGSPAPRNGLKKDG